MTTSSSAAASAQHAAEIQELTTNLSCAIATVALLLYDVLLTSGQEYQHIWRSRKSWFSRALYVWNRYMFLLYLLLDLGTIPSMSDTSCASVVWLTAILRNLNYIGPAMFTALRIYAVSRKNRVLGGVALALSMTPFVINMSTIYEILPINLPAPLNCTQANTASRSISAGLAIASRGSLIVVDSLAAAVTWHQTRAAIQQRTGTVERPSLEQVMWQNGIVYFCVLVSMNVVDMVLILLSIAIPPDHQSSYMVYFVDPISSILNSHFLLALHETNGRLEGATDMSISSLSINTGGGGDPEFLGIIGGSIHSTHGHDEDLESLEFALPEREREEEHHIEPESEIGEGGGDAANLA